MNCKFCNEYEKLVKNGTTPKGLQRYLCKFCGHKFADNGNSFARMRTPTHVIVSSLNLYFKGLSVRKVSDEVSEIFGEVISQVSIWGRVQKYAKIVSEYIETLRPNLSGKFHHDETEVKISGQGRYFWETIDEDSRYLLAHHLSKVRTSEEAVKVFKQALEKQRPIALFTDGSFAYDDAFNKVFYTRYKTNKVEWVRRVGIRAGETNNIVERLHSTLKERLRPMRGLKTDDTAQTLLDGYVAHYNFCRVHQAIQKTPAEAGGLQVKGWKQLIENAQAYKTAKEAECKAQKIAVEVQVQN